jgi:hypothetical protein
MMRKILVKTVYKCVNCQSFHSFYNGKVPLRKCYYKDEREPRAAKQDKL